MRLLVLFLVMCTAVTTVAAPTVALAKGSSAKESQAQAQLARPSKNGALHVEGSQLVDSKGQPVILRGVSTHGIAWYPQFVNEGLFKDISAEWDCNLVRLAFYPESYLELNEAEKEKLMSTLMRGIDACIAADQYVIVDWHILNEQNPLVVEEEALAFFTTVSQAYANSPNVLYEICNEPNGETTWTDIRFYADHAIPCIREASPDAVVLVGTPNFDRELMAAVRNPLDFDNVMYSLHFYASTHKADLRGELIDALSEGLPVFVTECGLSEATGDGPIDMDSAVEWFELLRSSNVSFTVWSLSNKRETSALILGSSEATTKLSDEDLSPAGLWVKRLIKGEDPASIARPAVDSDGMPVSDEPVWMAWLNGRDIRSAGAWHTFALASIAFLAVLLGLSSAYRHLASKRYHTYDEIAEPPRMTRIVGGKGRSIFTCTISVALSAFFTMVYLLWRMSYSIPLESGPVPIVICLLLLVVEMFGFVESVIHYENILGLRDHPLPEIADDEYPDVDIFIATYNEPCDLLRRTINGCTHLRYPDPSKVHIWVCDDNRRPAMRELAKEMGVGYFDRPDNKGAKAGNLNHALSLTSAPYVVTLDADMIVRSDFLLKTIPYFVDAEKKEAGKPEGERVRLGLLQTPQAFYDPDVFQHALYAEHTAPNEQDFFYRTIEAAKTSTNSVIYGGSNTVLARAALEAIGGFYTESITEDFATGMLIESAGFVSLGLSEPLASGRTPHTFKEHIQQRTRWGRGVIVTARKLKPMSRPGLSIQQRLSYWSSVVYWYSPIKNLIYLCAPLAFAVLGLPVFVCSWLDLLIYWLPMYLAQIFCLRMISGDSVSTKWSGIHEVSVMTKLLVPIAKEAIGITLSTFKVTDKSGTNGRRTVDRRDMRPYVILLLLSAIGVVRVIWLMVEVRAVGLLVILYWLIRNAYYLVMSIFLIDGRDSDGEPVCVYTAEPVTVAQKDGDGEGIFYGVATVLNEHSVRVYLDEADDLHIGDRVSIDIDTLSYRASLSGVVIGMVTSRTGNATTHTLEILDYGTDELEYLQILYDRVPSLPQSLTRDTGVLRHLWRNIANRIARTA